MNFAINSIEDNLRISYLTVLL